MDYTQNETLRQIFDEHWEEFCDYWAARTRDASQVETVRFDSERHTGVLMRLEWQGLKKIVAVTPQELLEGLTLLNEELRQRCIAGAESAEQAAGYATSQGDYAKREGDRVDALIQEISLLKQRVKEQGDTAEAQGNAAEALGNAAQAMKKEVEEWYSPFRSAAEQWYSGVVAAWNRWFAGIKADWTAWLAARLTEYRNSESDRELLYASAEESREMRFEQAEEERMKRIVLTKFYIHPETMELHVRQVPYDSIQYRIDESGCLIESFEVNYKM